MSRAALLLVVPVMLACAKKEAPPADTSAMAADTAAVTAAPNYAGNWTVNLMPQDKDSTLLTYTLQTTNDRTGWKIQLPDRPEMELRVIWMDKDSAVVENGPYASVLRKDVQVWTHSTMHLEGDRLVGTTIAHYSKGRDTVTTLRTVGTRQ
jgi:hypothetical protein